MRYVVVEIVVLAALANAQDGPTIEEICKLKPCREARPAQIWLDEKRYLEIDLAGTVIAHELNVSVYPGETHSISAQFDGKQIVDLTPSVSAEDTAELLIVKMTQERGKAGAVTTLLKVTNPFSYPLRYEAYMDMDGSGQFQYTSSCPVMPGISTYEHWPHAVVHIVMTNVRLLTEQEGEAQAVVCE